MFDSISKVIFVFVIFTKTICGAADLCSSPPPRINPHDCCEFPALFDKSTFDECGMQSQLKDHHGRPSCEKLACVFKKENMTAEDQKINKEMAKAYLDKWSISHPEWAASNEMIVEKCLSDAYLQSGPPHMCQLFKVVHCVSKMLLLNCPANYWTSSGECENVKTYFQQCHPN